VPLLVRTMVVCVAAALSYGALSALLRLDGWTSITARFTRLLHRPL
jgi:hypothetical protein